ncbi:MAG: hypothetical protein ACE5GT_14245, partial [Rhodospirillales bacterium]
MHFARARLVFLLAAFIVLAPLATAPRAEWTILKYDKNGHVVGVNRGKVEGGPLVPEAPAEGRFETGEVLVADPPKDFERSVRQLGFSIIEKVSLGALDTEVYRLRIPQGATVPDAVRDLQRRFPGLAVDANHRVDAQAAQATPEVRAREIIGWRAATSACGRGVRIGIIDGAVDLKHPALAGQGVDYRSF